MARRHGVMPVPEGENQVKTFRQGEWDEAHPVGKVFGPGCHRRACTRHAASSATPTSAPPTLKFPTTFPATPAVTLSQPCSLVPRLPTAESLPGQALAGSENSPQGWGEFSLPAK